MGNINPAAAAEYSTNLVNTLATDALDHQVISNHGIDDLGKTGPSLPQTRISTTCSITVLRNYRKYKYN